MTAAERELLVGLALVVLLDPGAVAAAMQARSQERWLLVELMADVENTGAPPDETTCRSPGRDPHGRCRVCMRWLPETRR